MAKLEVLLAGATGYIGGTILSTLLDSRGELLEHCNLSLLVRGEDKARVFDAKGLKTVVFDGLDNVDEVERIASNYDYNSLDEFDVDCPIVIINTTPGGSVNSAAAFIRGLGRGKASTGHVVSYIHTSGTSNLADQPITKAYHEPHTFTDTSPDLYPYLQHRESLTPYPQRTTDLTVISTGLSSSVKTYIIMPPTIYGTGTGLFNRLTIQAPTVMRAALRSGQVLQLGADDGDVECVHVRDLADLYILMANRVMKGDLDVAAAMPSGAQGIYFASTDQYNWKEFADGIAEAMVEVGGIKTKEVREVGLEEAAKEWTGGQPLVCELNFGSNFRTRPDTSRKLGWKPSRTKENFNNHYLETAKLVMESQK
ncbi:MAG: hypothetical protein Q9168_002161 [Polycauliona sp. 1 TL-2023]